MVYVHARTVNTMPRSTDTPTARCILALAGLLCVLGSPLAAELQGATATMVISLPDMPDPYGMAEPLDVEPLRTFLLADQIWTPTTADDGNLASASDDCRQTLRNSLELKVSRAENAAGTDVAVSVRHPDARIASSTVRDLADHLVFRLVSIRGSNHAQSISAAAVATDQAWQEMVASQDRLRQCVDRRFSQVAEKSDSPTVGKGPVAEVLNPEWINLDRELSELQRQRETLLADRTPAHPEISGLNHQIAALWRAKESCPRMIAEKGPVPAGTTARQSVETYQALTARLRGAERVLLQRWQQERAVRAVDLESPGLGLVQLVPPNAFVNGNPRAASSEANTAPTQSSMLLIWGLAGLLGIATLGFGSLGFFSRLGATGHDRVEADAGSRG